MNELKGAYEKGEEELKVAKTRSELTDYWTKEIISDLTMNCHLKTAHENTSDTSAAASTCFSKFD